MIKYENLEMALEFSSSAYELGDGAYVDTETGHIYYVTDVIDEEYPDDIHDNERYILVPDKKDLDLGKPLVMSFSEEYLPNNMESIYKIFSSRGAYSAFKNLLADHSLLDNWYEYEREETKKSLLQWCDEVGISVSI